MKPLLDEKDNNALRRFAGLANDPGSPEFQKAKADLQKEQFDTFLEIFQKEASEQRDRIVDRRFTAFVYGIIGNFAFTILGFILGRL
jgi:hypothetical protein